MTTKMSPSERRAAEALTRWQLKPDKRPETTTTKSPDFDVSAVDGFYFLAEVKAVVGPGQSEPLMWQALYNAISSDVYEAAQQFDAVNSTRLVPNVLILVSEDFRVHAQSFLDFMMGEIVLEGEGIVDLGRYRFGRVKTAFARIDLFIMLDIANTPSLFFTKNDPRFLQILTSLLRVG